MSEFEDTSGTDTAPVEVQDNSSEVKVNPGAIRKSTTNNILNALSNASGQKFDTVEAALAFMARTSNQNVDGNVQPVEKPQQKTGRVTNTDLAEQFSALQQNLAQKEQRLREKELDSDIQRVMGDKFDPDLLDYALTKVKSSIQWNEDGTYSIMNSKGQERYSSDGTPLSLSGLVQEVAKGNPKLLKQSSQQGGSGLRPGQGQFAGAEDDVIPDYSKDPAAFNAWATRNGLGKRVGLKGVAVGAQVTSMGRKIL
jgi:hypothetical protein